MSVRTKAFVNFYSAMGTLGAYTKLDAQAKGMAKLKDISVRFKVKGGPDGVLVFKGGNVEAIPYTEGTPVDVGLSCKNCELFNDLVDGKNVMPMPIKGLTKLGFLLKKDSAFNVLTGKMAELMRQTEFADADEKKLSTLLAFNAMVSAICVIGNEDDIGKIAAARIPEGNIGIEIAGIEALTIAVKKINGQVNLKFIPEKLESRSRMVFDNLDTAKGLIDGKLDAMTCIGTGKIAMSGYIPQLHALNNILSLVPKYLA